MDPFLIITPDPHSPVPNCSISDGTVSNMPGVNDPVFNNRARYER